MKEITLRIRVSEESPEGGLIKWLRDRPDGKVLILAALRAYWLASSYQDPVTAKRTAMDSWNALIQQACYLSMVHGFQAKQIVQGSEEPRNSSPSSSLEASNGNSKPPVTDNLMDNIFI